MIKIFDQKRYVKAKLQKVCKICTKHVEEEFHYNNTWINEYHFKCLRKIQDKETILEPYLYYYLTNAQPNKIIKCKCGCDELILIYDEKSQLRKYARNHFIGKPPSRKGMKLNEKVLLNMKNSWTIERRKKLSKKNISLGIIPPSRKGKKMSIESIKKSTSKRSGELHWLYGKHHTEQSKKKNREARLHRVFPLKDSIPEIMMQLALTLNGITFRTHESILGQPDIFIEPNICIFVDGDYWHANPLKYEQNQVLYNKKTAGQIWAYDISITSKLTEMGFQVIRIWESSIKANSNQCANNIISLIKHNNIQKRMQ